VYHLVGLLLLLVLTWVGVALIALAVVQAL
jgi:hypothetical protein